MASPVGRLPRAWVHVSVVVAASTLTTMAAFGVPDAVASREPFAMAELSAERPIDPTAGIGNIDHLIFVVQENRSFDHYFGTFPGAEGLPRDEDGRFTVCVPDPPTGGCRTPYHDTNGYDLGGPHGQWASRIATHRGRMDGFIKAFRAKGTPCTNSRDPDWTCGKATPGPGRARGGHGRRAHRGTPDVMGYHTANEIPNYWAYAERYLLQDHMFAPSDSWTLPSHLYLVSGWSAVCADPTVASTCSSEADDPAQWWELSPQSPNPYGWADITWLLHRQGVSWAYYVGPGSCVARPCPERVPGITVPAQNPLPGFQTMEATGQIGNVRANTEFFEAAAAGELPSVSWVMPMMDRSEHPPDSIERGQAWVTRVVNAVMKGPADQWLHTAIFLTWDDWGGFYDHVPPIKIDDNGYGIRVPGILISPYAKTGSIDSQTLSFDAYLKLIEDRFLGGQRLDGQNDGWPDPRPGSREEAVQLGDLSLEFDWTQEPIPPLILRPHPR
jgi:phospholipase C